MIVMGGHVRMKRGGCLMVSVVVAITIKSLAFENFLEVTIIQGVCSTL
jgi:hypothetical protein